MCNFITQEYVDCNRFELIKCNEIIKTILGEDLHVNYKVHLKIKSFHPLLLPNGEIGFEKWIFCYVVKSIHPMTPVERFDFARISNYTDPMYLADPTCNIPQPIDLSLGCEDFHFSMIDNIEFFDNGMRIIETYFGNVAVGKIALNN